MRKVVLVKQRIVDPELLLGAEVMVERHYCCALDGRLLTTVVVLISRAVPVERRGAVARRMLRQVVRQVTANDNVGAPDSRVLPAIAGV